MELINKIKINFEFDAIWLKSRNIDLSKRFTFLVNKYLSIILDKREINYLGDSFVYDTKFGPAILETYPKEVAKLNEIIDLSRVKTILDVGANVGQWSFTIKKLYPRVKIFSFEPNEKVIPFLYSNKRVFDDGNWLVFPYAISGKNEIRDFYFSEKATAEGGFYKENLSQNYVRTDIKKVKVESVSLTNENLSKWNIPHQFDLVKIDTEGAEEDVLKGLADIKFKYLQVEVKKNRRVGVTAEQVASYFKKKNVDVKLLHQDFFNNDSPAGNAIFKIVGK